MSEWSKQRVVIIGAARQGLALARYLLAQGAQVCITDLRPSVEMETARCALSGYPGQDRLEWVCGEHPLELLEGATLICPSGGVPLTLPLVVEAQRRGIPLSNDSQIFLEAAPCRVVGITGSAGKTTTTSLLGNIAAAAANLDQSTTPYRQVWVGGNIGSPLITLVDQMQADDLAVMELSSFQLEIMRLSPQVAAVLNITPNHLDRHGAMAAYTAAKAHILAYQSPVDWAILGRDDPGAWALASSTPGMIASFGLTALPEGQPGVYWRNDNIFLRWAGTKTGLNPASFQINELLDQPVIARDEIRLRGEHNLLNVMAACAIAAAADLPVVAMQTGIRDFKGVPHRLEFVRTWGGADWYNDSIATAPERAMAALRSFDEPLVLLAGGRDKNLPWEDFGKLVRQRVDHLILFGEAAEVIWTALHTSATDRMTVTRCQGLREAVHQAADLVEPGDIVLLAPGGTSFDEFKDFEERGECFARWVNELQ